MMLASVGCLRRTRAHREDIRWAISGNLCRCTGYQNIVNAVKWAGKPMKEA